MATNNNAVSLNQLKKSVFNMKNYVDKTKKDLEKNGVYIEDILDHVPLSEFTTVKEFNKESAFNGYINLNRLIETDNTKQYNYYMVVQTLEYNNSVGHSRIMKIGRNSTTNKLSLNSIIGDGNSFINTTMGYNLRDFTEYSINDGKLVVNNSESKSTFKIIIGIGFAKDRFANIEGYTTENYMQTKITVRLFKVDPSINTMFPIYSNEYGGLLSYDNSFSENTHKIGVESISMGLENDAVNNNLIMGNNNNIGKFSLVSGFKNTSKGYNVLIIGASNNLTANNSYALGDHLDISEQYTLAIGKYGTVPASLIFAVCNGTSDTDKKVIFGIERSTGLPVVDTAPTANNHLTNKKYVDDVKASIVVPTKTSELTNDSNFLTEHQSLTGLATETFVNNKVAGIVNSAPETLDTLQELAKALGNDPNFATTVSNKIGNKVDKVDGMSLTHNDLTDELKANYDAAYKYSQAKHSYNDLTDLPTIPSIEGLATKKYVDDNKMIECIPILRIDETNKLISIDCNSMGNYKKYFIPNKYANIYRFSFIYTNSDNTETEIINAGGTLTRDGFVICTRNTSKELALIIYDHEKYTYNKANKIITKGLYGSLAIGNTIEFTPTSDYNPATKKYVDDAKASIVVPTKTSELTNDSNFLTEHQSLTKYATIEYVDSKLTTNYVSKEELTESTKPADTPTVKTTLNDILGGDYIE